MKTKIKTLLVRLGFKSRTEKELMPSAIDDVIDDFNEAVKNLVDMANEGIQPGLTEHEAYIVRRAVAGMAETFYFRMKIDLIEGIERGIRMENILPDFKGDELWGTDN